MLVRVEARCRCCRTRCAPINLSRQGLCPFCVYQAEEQAARENPKSRPPTIRIEPEKE